MSASVPRSTHPAPRGPRAVARSLRLLVLAITAAVLLPLAWTTAAAGDGVSILLSVSEVPAPSASGSPTAQPTDTGSVDPTSNATNTPVDPTGPTTAIDPSGTGTGTSVPGPSGPGASGPAAVPTTDDPADGGGLAWTGTTAAKLILPALVLLLLGAAAIAFTRRRRPGRHTV